MSKLLLNLRMVLEDEVDDVRALLDAHRIEYYETAPSRWGISHGGIWVTHDQDLAQAKRSVRAREERATAVREGTAETFASTLRREPARVVLTILAILALLGLVA